MCSAVNEWGVLRRAPTGSSARILVVDDEPLVRRWVERVLVDGGYQVDTAVDGAAAIDELSRHAYELVLSDVTMPRLDGLSVLAASIAKDPTVPVVLMTGAPEPDFETRATGLGASCVLLKPMPLHTVAESVGRFVRLRRLQLLTTSLSIAPDNGEWSKGPLCLIGPGSVIPEAIHFDPGPEDASDVDGVSQRSRQELAVLCAELGISAVARTV